MAVFVSVAKLKMHDIGIIYKDERKLEWEGGALFCLTRKNTGCVPVNIQDFRTAQRMGLPFVVLKIVPAQWTRQLTMEKATALMESARQFEDADYKLISDYDADGNIEIPDSNLFSIP